MAQHQQQMNNVQAQQFSAQNQQYNVQAQQFNAQPQVNNYLKTTTLPDGTVIQRSLTSIVFVAPSGKTLQMTPAPQYVPSSGDAKYSSHKGHCMKLAEEKHLGHYSWNKRYITIEGRCLKYFEKEGESKPKGVINMGVGCWVKAAEKDSPKRKDAHSFSSTHGMASMLTGNIGSMMSDTEGTVGKDFCMEVHVPADVMQHLEKLMNTSVASLAFGGAKKLHENDAKTYYFHFDSKNERDQCVNILSENFNSYLRSDECFSDTQHTFVSYLQRIGVDGSSFDWKKILGDLYA